MDQVIHGRGRVWARWYTIYMCLSIERENEVMYMMKLHKYEIHRLIQQNYK